LDAALTHPSILLIGKKMPAISTFLVAALGTIAMLVSFYDSRGFLSAVETGLIIALPYFIVAVYLWLWPLHEIKDAAKVDEFAPPPKLCRWAAR
jgi:F0F1-type ATP synthase assembly protein I